MWVIKDLQASHQFGMLGPTYFNCNSTFIELVLNIETSLVSTETITVKSINSFFTSKIVVEGLYCKFMQKRMAYFKPKFLFKMRLR